MPNQITFFSPSLLNNFSGLQSYLSGENTIDFLKNNADKIQVPQKGDFYFGRWRICWIICKTPIEWLFAGVFFIIGKIADVIFVYYLRFPGVLHVFTVLSKQFTRDSEQYRVQSEYKERLLVPAFNAPQTSAYDVYLRSSVSVESIKDPQVKKITFNDAYIEESIEAGIKQFYNTLEYSFSKRIHFWPQFISLKEKNETEKTFNELFRSKDLKTAMEMLKTKYSGHPKLDKALSIFYKTLQTIDLERVNNASTISLFSPRGVCRGASIWFTYLCLHTEHLFQDPKKHLIAVAELFRTGVPSQGCLLQAFGYSEDSILGLERKPLNKHSVSWFEMDLSRETAVQKLRSLPPGDYVFAVHSHAFVYKKISEKEGYIWNPNSGLLTLDENDQAQQLFDEILQNHYKEGDPLSLILVTKLSLSEKSAEKRESA